MKKSGYIYHWGLQTVQDDQSKTLKLTRPTIISFQQKLRLVTARAFRKSEIILGGPGKVVEIDESLFVKVNPHKGKIYDARKSGFLECMNGVLKLRSGVYLSLYRNGILTHFSMLYTNTLPQKQQYCPIVGVHIGVSRIFPIVNINLKLLTTTYILLIRLL